MKTPKFASIRKYSGSPMLTEELVKRQDEIKAVLTPVPGFHSYVLIKTNDAVVSVTFCEDKAGAEQSNRVAATWLKDKLPTFANRSPEVTVGEVRIVLSEQPMMVAVD